MTETRTERLRILHLALQDMEKDVNEGNEFVNGFYQAALADMENCQWYTLWNLVLVDGDINLGGAFFKGGPNDNGEVEIGYGIEAIYQNKGYATEGIR